MPAWEDQTFSPSFPICREELAWAAGVFEGEGCFSTRHTVKSNGLRDRGIVAKLKMTDEDIVCRFRLAVGVGNVTGPHLKANRKPVWIWQVSAFEGVQMVAAMLWCWFGRRRQARIAELFKEYHAEWEGIANGGRRKARIG